MTKITKTKIKPEIDLVIIHPASGPGVYHIWKGSLGIGTRFNFIVIQRIIGVTNPVIQNGIIKIGLKAIGAPKTSGSLILKMEGTSDALPIILKREDFARNAIIIQRASVAPPPPSKIKVTASTVKIFTGALPAATAAWLAEIPGSSIAYSTGVRTQLEIPKEYRN